LTDRDPDPARMLLQKAIPDQSLPGHDQRSEQ
jgi:hypothetical protein